jgi:Major royal jelly protein
MRKLLLFLLIIGVALSALVWFRYGGGESYPDLSTPPILAEASLEEVLSYPEPIGNVAVSADGRLFFTVHPDSRPRGNRLLEFVGGAAVPFPDVGAQLELFDSVLGLTVDRQNRLWTIDHGLHGLRNARLLAFDLGSNALVHDHVLPPEIAPAGSTLQDLQVSADGSTVIIADTSILRQSPALIVYDLATGTARRVLESEDAVSAEDFLIHANGRALSFLGGLASLRGGVDGLTLGQEWLYFGALNGSRLFRVALGDLLDERLSAEELAARVEPYAQKPLSHGISADTSGNIYVTDVEHNSVYLISGDRPPRTLLRSTRIRWPDGLSLGPDGSLYITDSALPELLLKSREHIAAERPYRIFRIRTVASPDKDLQEK